MAQDYKMKYKELRSRFVSSLDVSFRLGYQKGQQDGQMQQMQQQQEQQQAQMQQMQQQMQQSMMNQQAPQSDQPPMGMEQGASDFEAQSGDEQQQSVSELEQGIQELEELLNKNEVDALSVKSMLNLLNGSLNKLKQSGSLKKSEHLKRMNDSKEIFKQSAISHNKSIQAKTEESHTIQKKIVSDILKKWENEEREAANDILKTIRVEGKVK